MTARRLTALTGFVVLLLLASADAGSAQSLPASGFATLPVVGFFGSADGDVPDSLELEADSNGAGSTLLFIAPGVSVGGLLPGLLPTQASQLWLAASPVAIDTELVGDGIVDLYFTAQVETLSIFAVRAYEVSSDGTLLLLVSEEKQFITALSPTAERFVLELDGATVRAGHYFGLEVAVETASVLVTMNYDAPDTPSGLQSLGARWKDSDGDRIADSIEPSLGRNPLNPDEPGSQFVDGDVDGLSDDVEKGLGTNPNDADSDDDTWKDGIEVHAGSNPLDRNSVPFDEDNDGLPDVFEYTYFTNTTYGANDDPDGDDCSNIREALYGTNPNDADTDGDGVADCDELDDGTDPTNAASYLGVGGPPEPVAAAAAFAIGSTLCLVPLIRRP